MQLAVTVAPGHTLTTNVQTGTRVDGVNGGTIPVYTMQDNPPGSVVMVGAWDIPALMRAGSIVYDPNIWSQAMGSMTPAVVPGIMPPPPAAVMTPTPTAAGTGSAATPPTLAGSTPEASQVATPAKAS